MTTENAEQPNIEPINQPTDQPTSQSTNQPINQPIHSIIYNPDRTAHSIHSGLPDWKPPTNQSTSIVEPVFSAEDKSLIDQLKGLVLGHLKENSESQKLRHPEHDNKHEIFASIHWRDIYHKHSHKTTVQPSTPDPRLSPTYQSTYQSIGPKCEEWLDYRWYQFLIGRKRNVKKAAIMALDYVSWYVNFGVEDLINQSVCPFSDAVCQFYPERFHGVALSGQPLLIGCAGSINVEAYLARSLPLEAAYITQTYKLEVCQRACLETSILTGVRHCQYTNIQDLAHFTYGHRVGIPWVQKCALIASNFYPESLSVSVVPNMPGWFSMLWSLLSTFLDERTQQKVEFPGSNWKQRLLHYVDIHQLPREWGGECTKCNQSANQSIHQSNMTASSHAIADGCLPYVVKYDRQALIDEQNKQVLALEGDASNQSMTIHARQVLDIPFEITKPQVPHLVDGLTDGSQITQFTLWWTITVLSKDIELSIVWKPDDHAEEVCILEPKKISAQSTDQSTYRGCHTFTVTTVHDLGVAKIRLNNSYSMFSSKQVTIKAGLTKIK